MEWYQDKTGDTSSKRIAGAVILSCGLGLLMVVGIMSISKVIADPSTALQVANTLMLTGGSLLGVGVIESFGKGK
jgi:CBS-domain-containing membrane protein